MKGTLVNAATCRHGVQLIDGWRLDSLSSTSASNAKVFPGATITYNYTIVNPNAFDLRGLSFVNAFADGRTFVRGSLQNPFGGEVGRYGSSSSLLISRMTIPALSSRAISVSVQIPENISPGLLINSALLTNVPTALGGSDVFPFPLAAAPKDLRVVLRVVANNDNFVAIEDSPTVLPVAVNTHPHSLFVSITFR